jgi:8-oxo-dGTP pyrophosphatase MutT (NUDIX family)
VTTTVPHARVTAEDIRARLRHCPCERLQMEGYRHASVLLPLFESSPGEWQVLLTRRTEDLGHHRGQIAFPGGSIEEGETPLDAALRETEEEIGLPRDAVDVLGVFSDIWTPTGFIITPVAGLLPPEVELLPNPAEVARIFSAPLAFFARPENAETRELDVPGMGKRTVYYYHVAGETVWGATAHILRQFLLCTGLDSVL